LSLKTGYGVAARLMWLSKQLLY